jgi:hypothetical protein
MPQVKEQRDSRRYTTASNGGVTAQRKFFVFDCPNEQAAIQAVEDDAGGKTFPNLPATLGMRLTGVDCEATAGDRVYLVTCNYGTAETATADFRNPPAQVPFWGWSEVQVEVEIPFIFTRAITSIQRQDDQDENIPPVIYVVQAGSRTAVERRIRRTLTVKATIANVRQLDVISNQTNKLHRIGSRWYRFIGADVDQDTSNPMMFTLRYTWEEDLGTKVNAKTEWVWESYDGAATNDPNTTNRLPVPVLKYNNYWIIVPNQGGIGERRFDPDEYEPTQEGGERLEGVFYVRFPYEVVDIVAFGLDEASLNNPDPSIQAQARLQAPTAHRVSIYEKDRDGWRQLPFIINLEGDTTNRSLPRRLNTQFVSDP